MKNLFGVISYIILISIASTTTIQAQSNINQEGYLSNNFTSSLSTEIITHNYNTNYSAKYYRLPLISQDTTKSYQIITNDGNVFIGTIIEQDEQKIVLKTEQFGSITIQKTNLQSMTLIEAEKIIDGDYWQDHMQSTRHFWMPNAYGLKKGEAYYQNVWIFFNQFSVGVTDNILLGGGLIPGFLFGGAPTPIWFTPKVSFPVVKNKVNVGAGGLFATALSADGEGGNLGIVYGQTTFGPRDKNVTLGVGYGYADGNWATKPTFSLGFISRVGRKGYFISENYLISTGSEYLFLGLIGGRSILGSGNVGLDYGLVVPITSDIGTFIALPWLGITVPLSQAKQ